MMLIISILAFLPAVTFHIAMALYQKHRDVMFENLAKKFGLNFELNSDQDPIKNTPEKWLRSIHGRLGDADICIRDIYLLPLGQKSSIYFLKYFVVPWQAFGAKTFIMINGRNNQTLPKRRTSFSWIPQAELNKILEDLTAKNNAAF